jgi:hypothetical protein
MRACIRFAEANAPAISWKSRVRQIRLNGMNAGTLPFRRGPVRRNHLGAMATTYAGQHVACREGLTAQCLPVAAMRIHFPLAAALLGMDARGGREFE